MPFKVPRPTSPLSQETDVRESEESPHVPPKQKSARFDWDVGRGHRRVRAAESSMTWPTTKIGLIAAKPKTITHDGSSAGRSAFAEIDTLRAAVQAVR